MFLTEFNQEEYDEELREEGIEEGRSRERQEVIMDFLSEHGEIPDDLKKRISEEERMPVLKDWTKLAARTKSIEEFWEKIQAD